MSKKCKQIKGNGKQCGMWAMVDGDYCLTHDPSPEAAQKRKERAAMSGRSQKLVYLPEVAEEGKGEPFRPVIVKKAGDIPKAMARIIYEVQMGRMKVDVARVQIYGLKSMSECVRDLELAPRIELLFKAAKEQGLIKDL